MIPNEPRPMTSLDAAALRDLAHPSPVAAELRRIVLDVFGDRDGNTDTYKCAGEFLALIPRIDARDALVAELAGVLVSLKFARDQDGRACCASCGESVNHGCLPNCRLAAALAKAAP